MLFFHRVFFVYTPRIGSNFAVCVLIFLSNSGIRYMPNIMWVSLIHTIRWTREKIISNRSPNNENFSYSGWFIFLTLLFYTWYTCIYKGRKERQNTDVPCRIHNFISICIILPEECSRKCENLFEFRMTYKCTRVFESVWQKQKKKTNLTQLAAISELYHAIKIFTHRDFMLCFYAWA